ncbi:MAG: hypothetical protein IJN08_05655 [Clostridia bacterium]|nr:hypothetical protein [Clostridia bacterium]
MVRVIFGEKGAGNSKRIIQMANDSLDQTKGSVVFIDAEGQYLFDLKHAIRFIDAGHYGINSPDMFLGFIAGIAAQDFDLERVYVDGLTKMVSLPLSSLEEMFSGLESFSVRSGIDVIIGANGDELPEYLKKYIVE